MEILLQLDDTQFEDNWFTNSFRFFPVVKNMEDRFVPMGLVQILDRSIFASNVNVNYVHVLFLKKEHPEGHSSNYNYENNICLKCLVIKLWQYTSI